MILYISYVRTLFYVFIQASVRTPLVVLVTMHILGCLSQHTNTFDTPKTLYKRWRVPLNDVRFKKITCCKHLCVVLRACSAFPGYSSFENFLKVLFFSFSRRFVFLKQHLILYFTFHREETHVVWFKSTIMPVVSSQHRRNRVRSGREASGQCA